MWLGEKITDKGIGNGISLIIMVGILARFPHSFIFEAEHASTDSGLIAHLIELSPLCCDSRVSASVQGTRRIPVQYARRIVATNSTAA